MNTIRSAAIFLFLILVPALLDSCLQGPDELHYDNPRVECMRNIAQIQISAAIDGYKLCYGYQPCIDDEIAQRALITAQYIEDLCSVNRN